MLLVFCQLSRDVIGYEDSYALLPNGQWSSQRQREREKKFKKQNNTFARAARFLVHFFAVRARPPREISSCDVL